MATPTMSNARKPYHQLSSCFVDTVPDSLDGIYRSLDNFAKVSKFGGGMGMYFGKVRAAGSTIRGFQGAAGGVIRWIRLVNDTAVAVDQLGMRQGAVAVYLDAWHRDLPEFLQLRTNNGDDRMKAHDVFPAVCYPDLFWRLAEENIDAPWHLMCPHEILTVKATHWRITGVQNGRSGIWTASMTRASKSAASPSRTSCAGASLGSGDRHALRFQSRQCKSYEPKRSHGNDLLLQSLYGDRAEHGTHRAHQH